MILALRTRSGAERELAELRAFARDELGLVELQSWDVAFASEKLKEKKIRYFTGATAPVFSGTKSHQRYAEDC